MSLFEPNENTSKIAAAGPLSELLYPQHITIRRNSHEPRSLMLMNPEASDIRNVLSAIGSTLQSEQIQLGLDLVQGWKNPGAVDLHLDLETFARFPTQVSSHQTISADRRSVIIAMQGYAPHHGKHQHSFSAEPLRVEFSRSVNRYIEREPLQVTLTFDGAAPTPSESLERWMTTDKMLSALGASPLPTAIRAPKPRDRAAVLTLPFGSLASLNVAPISSQTTRTTIPVWSGTLPRFSTIAMFEALQVPQLALRQELLHGVELFLETLAPPSPQLLAHASEFLRNHGGVESLRFSIWNNFGIGHDLPPQAWCTTRVWSLSDQLEVSLYQTTDAQNSVTISAHVGIANDAARAHYAQFCGSRIAKALRHLG